MNKSVKVKVNGIHCFPTLPLARPAAHYSRQPKCPFGAPVCFDQDVQHSPIRQISLLAVQSNAGGCAADAVVSSRATPV